MTNKALTAASLFAAGLASLCCIGPLVAFGIGLGTFGAAALFEGMRPYLLIVTGALLVAGFYLAYRKQPTEQCADGSCAVMSPKLTQKRLLWLLALIVVPLAAFPYYSGVFWASADFGATRQHPVTPSTGAFSEELFAVEGMTCAGCAVSVQATLEQKPGVTSAEVNLDDKTARVKYDASRVSIGQLITAIRDLWFTATPQPGLARRLPMKTELYYFDGCPSYQRALANLKEALRLEGLPEDVAMIHVDGPDDAQAKSFIGSPTIRIDSVDVEGPDAEKKGYGHGCRIYSENGGSAGWPSVQRIRLALRPVPSRLKP